MSELDPLAVPADFVKEGGDWLAVFNPKVPRQMDVQLISTFAHEHVVCSVKFSPDGHHLAVGCDRHVVLYHLPTGHSTTFTLSSDSRNYARSVAFSPDGTWLASGSEDSLVRVWSVERKELVHTLQGHQGEVYALAFAPTEPYLVSASGDRSIRLWSLPSFDPARVVIPIDDPENPSVAFTSLAVSHSHIAAGSLDGAIRVWEILSGEMVERLHGHSSSVYSLSVPCENALVSGALDNTLKRWELRFDGNGQHGEDGHGERGSTCLRTFRGHKDYVLATATVREGQNLRAASASRDGSVRLWDLKSGSALFSVQGHKNTVTSVDLSADGKLLVSGSGDAQVRLWSYTII